MKTLITLTILTLASCTTMRTAQRKHDRIVKNFPNVHRNDTVTRIDTVTVTLPKQVIKGKTVFEKCPEVGGVLRDSTTLEDGTTINTSLIGNEDGTKTLELDVTVPEKKVKQAVEVKCPTIEVKVYPYWLWWVVVYLGGLITGVVIIKKKK